MSSGVPLKYAALGSCDELCLRLELLCNVTFQQHMFMHKNSHTPNMDLFHANPILDLAFLRLYLGRLDLVDPKRLTSGTNM